MDKIDNASTWTDQEKNVFSKSTDLPPGVDQTVQGFDFNQGTLSSHNLRDVFYRIGFQATSIGLAIDEINRMVIIFLQLFHCVTFYQLKFSKVSFYLDSYSYSVDVFSNHKHVKTLFY